MKHPGPKTAKLLKKRVIEDLEETKQNRHSFVVSPNSSFDNGPDLGMVMVRILDFSNFEKIAGLSGVWSR